MSRHVDDGIPTTTGVTTHSGSDMRAAFMGLIIGALVLLGFVFTVVTLTNRSFKGHEEGPATGAAQHGAPPAGAPAASAPAASAPPTGAPAAGAPPVTPPVGAPAAGAPTTPPPSTPL